MNFPRNHLSRLPPLSRSSLQVALRTAEKQFGDPAHSPSHAAMKLQQQQEVRRSLSSLCKRLLVSPHRQREQQGDRAGDGFGDPQQLESPDRSDNGLVSPGMQVGPDWVALDKL